MSRKGIAARAGHWSATHRKTAIFAWLGFVVLALFLNSAVGTKTLSDADSGDGQSKQAEQATARAFPDKTGEVVLVQSNQLTVEDPKFRAAVGDVTNRLAAVSFKPSGSSQATHFDRIETPYEPNTEAAVSDDGHSVLVNFEIPGDDDAAQDRVDAALAAVAASQKAHPGFTIEEFGDASANKEISKSYDDDFHKAELTSLPLTLIILLLAFGAVVAALVPLLLALTAVMAAIGLLGPISQIAPVEESITSVVLLIGLAVGVDYSMFYLRREREERVAGRNPDAALDVAAATSGRAVMISGLTVMLAMAGMYVAGDPTFVSFATGTILVVAVAVIGSLTVLPAVLAALGDRVEKLRIPFLKRKREGGESRLWSAILDPVLRHPVMALIVAGGFLVLLALPTLRLNAALPGLDSFPRSISVIRTYDKIQAAFPGDQLSADVVVQADDVTAPQVQRQVAALRRRAAESDLLFKPVSTDVSPDKTVEVVSIPIAGDGSDPRSNAALEEIRGELVPATVGSVDGVAANVTGFTAQTRDFNDLMNARIFWVFAFVLSAAFLLLLVTFRSIVIPLKAIFLNLLSVAAAYGVLVLIFQDGHLQSLIGFHSNGSVTSWLPLFLFVVLFGLSMDYHVFILTRIREAYDGGMNTEDAVAHGIKTTAGVVTSAALVMVAVFAVFATLTAIEFKELGVGLGVAILIDATIVRGVLLPASMTLLGDWNWYLPRWLQWLPHVTHEPQIEPPPAAAEHAGSRAPNAQPAQA